jgi:hypothetical protein
LDSRTAYDDIAFALIVWSSVKEKKQEINKRRMNNKLNDLG